MELQLTGRIDKHRSKGQKFFTLLQTPAPDPYSQPSTYLIRSEQQLGQLEDEISISCVINAFVKKRGYTDRNTGVQDTAWDDVVMINFKQHLSKPTVAKAS